MRCEAVLKLGFDGAMPKGKLAAGIYVNYLKMEELLQQLLDLKLVRFTPESDVELTPEGNAEFERLKGSKIIAKSEAGA